MTAAAPSARARHGGEAIDAAEVICVAGEARAKAKATITFAGGSDFKQEQAALLSIIKQWVEFQVESAE